MPAQSQPPVADSLVLPELLAELRESYALSDGETDELLDDFAAWYARRQERGVTDACLGDGRDSLQAALEQLFEVVLCMFQALREAEAGWDPDGDEEAPPIAARLHGAYSSALTALEEVHEVWRHQNVLEPPTQ